MSNGRGRFGNIDFRLLMQMSVRSRLVALAHSVRTPARLNKELDHLKSLGEHVELGAIKLLEGTTDEKEATMAANLLLRLDPALLSDQLLKLIESRQVSDISKSQALRVMAGFGWDIHELVDVDLFQDFQKLASNSLAQLLQDLQENPTILGYILEEVAEFIPEMQLVYVRDLVKTKDQRVVPILAALAQVRDHMLAREAIKGLGSIISPEALRVLQEISETAEDVAITNLAAREANRLSFKGIKPAAEDGIQW
ncbi:MAG: HEAT repeat domain-containing protein, partial [bacterium]|nr:HEAT repeat domain-containing protein [bacterium]